MKRWLEALSAVAAVLATCGVLIGGVRWAVDPLREDVQALREEFRTDIGELRAEVRTEIDQLRVEVRTEIDELRVEVRADIGELRAEVRADIGDLRTDMADIRERLVRVEEAVRRLEVAQEASRG